MGCIGFYHYGEKQEQQCCEQQRKFSYKKKKLLEGLPVGFSPFPLFYLVFLSHSHTRNQGLHLPIYLEYKHVSRTVCCLHNHAKNRSNPNP